MVAGIAAANGLITRVDDSADLDETANPTNSPAPSRRWRAARRISARWHIPPSGSCGEPDPKQWVWTDDYSDIVGSMLRNLNP